LWYLGIAVEMKSNRPISIYCAVNIRQEMPLNFIPFTSMKSIKVLGKYLEK